MALVQWCNGVSYFLSARAFRLACGYQKDGALDFTPYVDCRVISLKTKSCNI